jgi:iron complex outermembrane recepter protein
MQHGIFRRSLKAVMILFPAMTVLALLPDIGMAAEPDPDDTIYLMEEIVVSGTVPEPTSGAVIDGDLIRSQRADTAADILGMVPGAVVTVGSKNSSEIMIRGFRSSDVLVMVDGRPVNDPYYGKIDLSTIGLGNAARIRVITGAPSVRYGPNAMGGVVNIVTDGSQDGPALEVRGTAGPARDIRADIVHRGTMRGVGYRVHMGRSGADGFPLSSAFDQTSLENGGLRNNADSRRTDLDAKLFFGDPDNPRWNLSASHSHLNKGLPSSVYEPRFWRFRKWDRTSIDLDGEPVRSETFRLKTKIYAERFQNELIDYRTDSYDREDIYWDSTHDNRSAGFLVSSSFMPVGRGRTHAGVQARLDESHRQEDTGADWFVNRTATTWVFVEHERTVATDLFLRGGLSGHVYQYDSWNRTESSLNPSLHLAWYPGRYSVVGAYSRVSRFPTLRHLYSKTAGNPDLNPEWAHKGEISIAREFPGNARIAVTGFASRVHEMIHRAGRLARYHNIARAKLDGVEITGMISPDRWNAHAGITLLNARDDDGIALEYRPDWKIDSRIGYRIMTDMSLSVTSRIVGERRTETGGTLEPFAVVDAGVVLGETRAVSLTVAVRNILDELYEEEYGYPMAGRVFLLGLDWRWDDGR